MQGATSLSNLSLGPRRSRLAGRVEGTGAAALRDRADRIQDPVLRVSVTKALAKTE